MVLDADESERLWEELRKLDARQHDLHEGLVRISEAQFETLATVRSLAAANEQRDAEQDLQLARGETRLLGYGVAMGGALMFGGALLWALAQALAK